MADRLSLFIFSSLLSFTPVFGIDYLSIGTGGYSVMKEKGRSWQFDMEYKFLVNGLGSPYKGLEFRPLIGVMGTVQGSTYIYGGLNFDFLLFDSLLLAPGFAAGYYAKGKGKDLGYPLEFRSGLEVAWRLESLHRIGVHFYHLSNASLGWKNPGEESFILFYDIPLIKGFPFIRDN
jgi:lipid A 3-O-deacylase